MSETEAFKIMGRDDWTAFQASGAYGGSEVDRADGYIHMSTAGQLAETARRHYADRRDLVILTVDLAPLGEALKWEASRGGALFPHLFADLPRTAVTQARAAEVVDGEIVWGEPA